MKGASGAVFRSVDFVRFDYGNVVLDEFALRESAPLRSQEGLAAPPPGSLLALYDGLLVRQGEILVRICSGRVHRGSCSNPNHGKDAVAVAAARALRSVPAIP